MEVRTTKVVLGSPLTVRGKEVRELTMREPLVEDMLEAAEMAGDLATSARLEICALAYLCDVPLGDFMKMRQADYSAVSKAYSFLELPVPQPEIASEKPSLSLQKDPAGDGEISKS